GFGAWNREALRTEPMLELLRVGPRLENALARRVDHAGKDDLGLVRSTVGEVRGELVQDLRVALALELLLHGHLPAEGDGCFPRPRVLERGPHDATVADRKNDQLRLDDFVVDAFEEEPFAALEWTHLDADAAARPRVRLCGGRRPILRGHPVHDVLGLRIGLPDQI